MVLSEGKLDPAASPPRLLLLCPPSVSHFKLQESHQLQLLLFACVLDHCPGRCPANSGGYLVLSFHFLKGPFEYSSTLKQCATCSSFPSRNSAWSFKLPSLREVCGARGGQLVACDFENLRLVGHVQMVEDVLVHLRISRTGIHRIPSSAVDLGRGTRLPMCKAVTLVLSRSDLRGRCPSASCQSRLD